MLECIFAVMRALFSRFLHHFEYWFFDDVSKYYHLGRNCFRAQNRKTKIIDRPSVEETIECDFLFWIRSEKKIKEIKA